MNPGHIHIVPVGTSLPRYLDPKVKSGGRSSIPQAVRDAFPLEPSPLERLRKAHGEDDRLDVTPLLHDDADVTKVSDGLVRLGTSSCAELASLYAPGSPEPAVTAGNAVVLLASDTDEGLRAAALVAHILSVRMKETPRYIDEPLVDSDPLWFADGGLWLVRIPGLDLHPNQAEPGPSTWQAVGEIARSVAHALCDGDADRHAVFHLNGGYKAFLPYVLTAAEAVRTVVRKRLGHDGGRVRASVLHETSEKPFPLPVRWLSGTLLELVQDLAAEVKDTGHVSEACAKDFDDLCGMYLSEGPVEDTRPLTDAGMIMTRGLWALGDPRS